MWTISRARADSLRDAGGTIAVLCNLQACQYLLGHELQGRLFSLKSQQITSKNS